ncbi:MAG: site-specific DNA-methyltransferase [Acidimicrobiia bacterium]|nr:site-specific DNA-methyltransferase [Acidimicrobiia bacterium]
MDPYAGSGTTLLAAQELGRSWVGIELKPDYVELIERRLADRPIL